ncbi:phage baseplate assembly protein V [Sediminicurvatus halobius]|uniref:Phage baseplate assembly protein V n=1 Tax=Sediminicurvatus halobius TaxID=2182432 RepID=A0A2U2N1D7_9GAMM|nr:phage baseplate assembly protein V [Spiribacter halobius]PWG62867.1 phage baseplate assembly protein V [Spiribacter halobius]UEX76981.1 phage baseplate assembly protein V [Spiribacter halobius]
MRETLERLLAPIWRRLRLIVSRGVIGRSDDARRLQVVQVSLLAGETARMERFQEYGFSSRPLEGAEAIAAAVGGARGHLVAVAVDDRRHRRRDQQPGEVAIYTDEGDEIRMRRGRVIEVISGAQVHVTAPDVVADCDTATVQATTSVTLDSPSVTVTGDLSVQGAIDAGGDVKAGAISLQQHVHGSVQSGTEDTGVAK